MNKEKNLFSLRSMAFTAVMAAVICVAAPFSVPMPLLVPISLATFAVYLAGALLGAERASLAVIIYILIGAVGLPVFSGFSGGFAKLFGVTGGYIFGYIPCAFLTGLFADLSAGRKWLPPVGMVAGTAACYLLGTAWFMFSSGSDLRAALAACVLPFLAGDAIKIIAASAVAFVLKPRIDKALIR